MKTCKTCRLAKPESCFAKNKATKDGLQWKCRGCFSLYYETPEFKDATRSAHLVRRFGITIREYRLLLASQSGRCATCATDKPGGKGAFHVDHVHVDGYKTLARSEKRRLIRGLLCHNCNRGIGYLKDDPELLQTVVEYLRVER